MSAITSNNIVPKIGFLLFGSDNELTDSLLRKDMIKYCRKKNGQYISYQAIYKWFDSTKPSRVIGRNSLLFLRDYFYDKIVRSKLDGDQKKVYDQIEKFFIASNIIDRNNSSREQISILENGSLQIQLGLQESDLINFGKTIVGNYITYRYRFGASAEKRIAQEFLDISMFGSQIRFRQSYIKENSEHSIYRGVVVPVGDIIWLIGLASGVPPRLRTLQFRNTDELDPNSTSIRWGIVSSNIPDSINKDPAACRIVMEKIPQEIPEMAAFSKDNTKFISDREFRHPQKEQVMRLINNHTTAHSIYGSVQPQVDPNGALIIDSVLKVDQRTIEDYYIHYKHK